LGFKGGFVATISRESKAFLKHHPQPGRSDSIMDRKTTCKDRWRQIINEANRIPNKHLFTLQQGISAGQLDEMETEQITLVVPAPYIKTYPQEKRNSIWTLHKFIAFVKERASL